MTARHLAPGIDDEPRGRGCQHRFGDHQDQHDEQRRADQIARKLDP